MIQKIALHLLCTFQNEGLVQQQILMQAVEGIIEWFGLKRSLPWAGTSSPQSDGSEEQQLQGEICLWYELTPKSMPPFLENSDTWNSPPPLKTLGYSPGPAGMKFDNSYPAYDNKENVPFSLK